MTALFIGYPPSAQKGWKREREAQTQNSHAKAERNQEARKKGRKEERKRAFGVSTESLEAKMERKSSWEGTKKE